MQRLAKEYGGVFILSDWQSTSTYSLKVFTSAIVILTCHLDFTGSFLGVVGEGDSVDLMGTISHYHMRE